MNEMDFFLRTLEERVDPTHLLERVVGAPADPWQKVLLTTTSSFVMCLASRRIGKSQTTGVLAAQTVAEPDRTVLILSTTLSQSQLLFKKCLLAWSKMALPIKAVRATQTAL